MEGYSKKTIQSQNILLIPAGCGTYVEAYALGISLANMENSQSTFLSVKIITAGTNNKKKIWQKKMYFLSRRVGWVSYLWPVVSAEYE